MVICAAYGCNSRSGVDKVSFFRFPKDVGFRKIWIQRLNRGESATKDFAPNSHHKLCSKHFEDSAFVLSPKFAEEIGYGERFHLRLNEDALPTIFEAPTAKQQKRQIDRRSASAILEKKRKLEVKSSLSRARNVTTEPECDQPSFFDSDSFTAVPFLSADTTRTATTTVTTSSASSSSMCQTIQSSHCPLTWFADVTLTQPKVQSSPSETSSQTATSEKKMFSTQCQTP